MSSPVGGSRIPEQIGQAGGVRMNVREYFNACKNETMSTPKAVFSAIKFAFSSQTGKQQKINDLQQQPQSAPTHQVSSQRAAEQIPCSLTDSECRSLSDKESSTFGRDLGSATRPKEAAQYVMDQLREQFPDYRISTVGTYSDVTSELVFVVKIEHKNDNQAEARCISVKLPVPGTKHTFLDSFRRELDNLNNK